MYKMSSRGHEMPGDDKAAGQGGSRELGHFHWREAANLDRPIVAISDRTGWWPLKTLNLAIILSVGILLIVYVRLLCQRRRRMRQAQEVIDYDAELQMNLTIRRARAVEAMQREHDIKAREFR